MSKFSNSRFNARRAPKAISPFGTPTSVIGPKAISPFGTQTNVKGPKAISPFATQTNVKGPKAGGPMRFAYARVEHEPRILLMTMSEFSNSRFNARRAPKAISPFASPTSVIGPKVFQKRLLMTMSKFSNSRFNALRAPKATSPFWHSNVRNRAEGNLAFWHSNERKGAEGRGPHALCVWGAWSAKRGYAC